MKNQLLSLTISAMLGTTVVYGLMELESFIHRANNTEYADMASELAELAIPHFGLVLMFFMVVYPYQFVVLTLNEKLERWGFSAMRTAFVVLAASTLLYSIGFTFVFRSPHLGTSDIIQTFGLGTLIFGVYFLTNLSIYHFLTNTRTS